MQSTLRIPRVASAVLVLGAACGDDETSDIDTSEARKNATVKAICKQAVECGTTNTSLAQCESDYASYVEEYASAGDDCVDALLDYYDCYAALDCEQDEDKLDAAAEKCARDAELSQRCEDAVISTRPGP